MLSPNEVFGHYRVESAIGAGGMGEVFLARDTKLDRLVAIKCLTEEFSKDADKLSRFIQEAKAASALNHPNILTVYEVGERDGNQFIVTEYIEGKTLSDLIEKDSMSLDKVLNYAVQIGSALAAAHEAGIIHRDIKASNVMVRKDGILKLLDFGLAKLTASDEKINSEASTIANVLTLPGTLMGTPTYMSPEQARGKKLDVRTDIFSFGILLFEMLTGRRPFVGESYADVMGAILKDEPPPLDRYMKVVPPELNSILTKTLRKDREKRYQSVKDLVIDLKDLREELKFEAKIHSTHGTKSGLVHRTDANTDQKTLVIEQKTGFWTNISKMQIAIIAIAGILLVGAIGWFAMSSRNQAITQTTQLKKQDIVSWNSTPGELFSRGEFSPDGKMVAFSSAKSGSRNIWIKQTATGESIQVTRDEDNSSNPVWSPDGTEIAYFSDRGNSLASGEKSTGIWRIPTFRGTPVSVAPIEDGGAILRGWSKSGKLYFESNRNFHAVEISSGKSTQLTEFPPNEAHTSNFSISEDESNIAFVDHKDKKWTLKTLSVSGGESDVVLESEQEIGNVVWHPDGQRVFYDAYVNGTSQVFVISANGSNSVQLTFSDLDSSVTDVSSDGSNILIGSAKEESNLWQVELASQNESAVSSSINSELWASVSSDSKIIAFQSVKNLSQGNNLLKSSILTMSPDSDSQPREITDDGFLPSWSPTGKQLAFLRREGEEFIQIWSILDEGGREQKLTKGGVQTIGYSVSPYNRIQSSDYAWSPDGGKIAFISRRKGVSNIWSVNSDGSGEKQLTKNSDKGMFFYCPIWSKDGSRIAYSTKSRKPGSKNEVEDLLWFLNTESGEIVKVTEDTSNIRLIGWNAVETGLIFAKPSKTTGLPPEVVLTSAEIDSVETKNLATLENSYYYNIQLSPDRQKIAFVSHLDDKDDVWILDIGSGKKTKATKNNDSNLYFSSLAWSPDGEAIYFGKQTRYSLLSMLTDFK